MDTSFARWMQVPLYVPCVIHAICISKRIKKPPVFLHILHSYWCVWYWACFSSFFRSIVAEVLTFQVSFTFTSILDKNILIFWISVTHPWKRLDFFCNSSGCFVLLPHGPYFSNTEFILWVACSRFVAWYTVGIAECNQSTVVWAKILCTNDPTTRLLFL